MPRGARTLMPIEAWPEHRCGKAAHESAAQAKNHARILTRIGLHLTPYRCRTCSWWHLSGDGRVRLDEVQISVAGLDSGMRLRPSHDGGMLLVDSLLSIRVAQEVGAVMEHLGLARHDGDELIGLPTAPVLRRYGPGTWTIRPLMWREIAVAVDLEGRPSVLGIARNRHSDRTLCWALGKAAINGSLPEADRHLPVASPHDMTTESFTVDGDIDVITMRPFQSFCDAQIPPPTITRRPGWTGDWRIDTRTTSR